MSGQTRGDGLGVLEGPIMDVLWAAGEPLTVRQIRDAIPGGHDRAYTTVMTVCGILAGQKNLARRARRGRAWLYEAAMSHDDWAEPKLVALLAPSADPEALAARSLKRLRQRER